MSGTILSTRDMTVTNSDKNLCLHRASNLERRQKIINKRRNRKTVWKDREGGLYNDTLITGRLH